MALRDFFARKKVPEQRGIRLLSGERFQDFIGSGYTRLSESPEIVAGCYKIAELIASMTIYLMANTDRGDVRVVNELSRKLDIEPSKYMTRHTWMTSIVMNLLLYGQGNSIVYPHTDKGLIGDLEPIAASRVSFSAGVDGMTYKINIDNKAYDPADLLHFVFNPSRQYMWMGQGMQVPLRPLAENLSQAAATKKGFMQSKWKPSIIVKVDALVDEFSSPEGREKLVNSYLHTAKAGQPWIIPAEQFSVEQVKPLSLNDLAINDAVQLDKRTVAALLGVPPFVLGVGEYRSEEWDNFISSTVRPIAQEIEQEMTRKLILSNKMYVMFNMGKLYSYDLQRASAVYGGLYDKGIVTGNEVREKIGMQPREGLDGLIVLENYIPIEDVGNQKKLGGND